MSGSTPMRNENEDTDFHGLRSQIFTIYPRSSAFICVLFTKQFTKALATYDQKP